MFLNRAVIYSKVVVETNYIFKKLVRYLVFKIYIILEISILFIRRLSHKSCLIINENPGIRVGCIVGVS